MSLKCDDESEEDAVAVVFDEVPVGVHAGVLAQRVEVVHEAVVVVAEKVL